MKFFLIFLTCLVVFETSYAQNIIGDARLPGKPLIANRSVTYSGSPYLTDDWMYGTITLKSGAKFENQKMRYNVMDDAIEFWREGSVFLLDPITAKEFSFTNPGGPERIFRNGFSLPDHTERSYFEVVHMGKTQVIRKHTKQIVDDPGSAYGSKLSQALKDQETLFYILADNSTGVLKTNKKSITSLFPSQQENIEGYLKEKKLNPRNDNDLKLIFLFIDTQI